MKICLLAGKIAVDRALRLLGHDLDDGFLHHIALTEQEHSTDDSHDKR